MKRLKRILIRVVLMVGVPAIAVWIAVEVYLAGGRYVTAENAYVKTDIVNIGSEVNGRVVRVFVNDYAHVELGQPLFEIDPEPFGIAIAMADAEMAAVEQEVEALRALYRQGEAEIRAAEEDVRYLRGELERQQSLVDEGAGTQSKLDAAEHELNAAIRELAVLREQNAVVLADLGGSLDSPVEDQPMYRAAEAMRRDASMDMSRTLVTAPMDGTLSQVLLEVGEYIEAGDPVFALVATREPWIEVNLKEVDLTYVVVGQAATVVVDAYPDVVWSATVDAISPATGAEFALLPPQNSTGNWVKVVQRVPVRLRLEDGHEADLLRSGMTVTVSIDTGQERTFDGVVDGVLADVLPSE
tara:strand:- start:901 stop:1968 length:1068 start_codon:yes stop_codon:yes gene_type:complete